jgi:molybdenum cofactor biosynthesis protein B
VSSELHKRDAPSSIRYYVLTISDSRTQANDTSGDAIVELVGARGHVLAGRQIVKDDPDAVRAVIKAQQHYADVIITTGGTGITTRDSTYEALSGMLDKRIDGFGELFRMLSYEEIGSAAMMSRACAGTIGRTALFSLPGSEAAVRLGVAKLILPELGHVVRELRR